MKKEVAEIYDRHEAELRGFITRRVAFREDAEDILQNVFYQLARIDLVKNPIEHISAWLYTVTRRQIIDRSRKRREERLPAKRKKGEDDYQEEIGHILADSENSPEREYLKALVWEQLESALAELPDEQRSVFELTELQGFSFAEISESTGIGVNTLISRKRYAVLHLRERLRELYDDLTRT